MAEHRPRVYFGVGISTYESFADLPAAAPKVRDLAAHLGTRGYVVAGPITDPKNSEEEARAALNAHLGRDALQAGSCLIVLWSGHADRQPEGDFTSSPGTRQRAGRGN